MILAPLVNRGAAGAMRAWYSEVPSAFVFARTFSPSSTAFRSYLWAITAAGGNGKTRTPPAVIAHK